LVKLVVTSAIGRTAKAVRDKWLLLESEAKAVRHKRLHL